MVFVNERRAVVVKRQRDIAGDISRIHLNSAWRLAIAR